MPSACVPVPRQLPILESWTSFEGNFQSQTLPFQIISINVRPAHLVGIRLDTVGFNGALGSLAMNAVPICGIEMD